MTRTTIRGAATLLLIAVALTACVTAADLDARLKTWIGKDADVLASSWGAPSGSYQKKDGGKILSYESSSVITTGVSLYADTTSRSCRIDFTVSPANEVESFTWRGTADQCDKLIMPRDISEDLDDLEG